MRSVHKLTNTQGKPPSFFGVALNEMTNKFEPSKE